MSTSEYRKKAGDILKGHYGESFFAVMICLLLYIFIKISDIAYIGFMLYNNNMNTDLLFAGNSISSAALKVISGAVRLAVMTPLITGGLWWFYQTAAGCDNKNILKLYAGFRLNIRAFTLYSAIWILSVISLVPSAVCWTASYYFYSISSEFNDQTLILFVALQLFMAGIFLLGLYLKCISSLLLAPFIFLENPDKNIFKVIDQSRRLVYGYKLECLKLLFRYLIFMLPVVTIPFVLPKAVMSVSVFACERIGGKSGNNNT